MCSSPKGSSRRARQGRKKDLTRAEYEEQALMLRRASAVYDRIEQRELKAKQLSNKRPSE